MGFFIRFAFIYDFRNFLQKEWNLMKNQIPFHILIPVYSRATASAFICTLSRQESIFPLESSF